jgi:hypothetical protein
MRASVVYSTVAVLCALAGCSSHAPGGGSDTGGAAGTTSPGAGGDNQPGGSSGGDATGGSGNTGGTIDTGGTTGSGGTAGTTSSGGTTGAGGSISTGGAGASGGAVGGSGNSGGSVGAAGSSSRGGSSGSSGTTGSGGTAGGAAGKGGGGGTAGSGGSGGSGGSTAPYQGPCDLVASGCAEAYAMTRAMTLKYTGPLFQIGLAKDKTKLLDIGQTSDHKADMTTWSAFCGGTTTNCVVSKIYAQVHPGSNDLVPGVFKTPWNPDCSAGGFTCAAKFTIESATGLPIVTTDSPAEYSLSNDNFATGINGGSKAIGILYNGKPVANQVYCCGVIGITHKYNATDTTGTDFMLALAYGWKDSGGCCIATNCGANNKYCVGAEEEENNDLYDYGTSPLQNAWVITEYSSSANSVITYLNGTKVLTHSPPKAGKINAGTAVHLGGGGDLSQPAPVRMREAFFTNNILSDSDVSALKTNVTTFFSTLQFQ